MAKVKYSRLVALGCSNTFGYGLKDCFNPHDSPSKYVWASVLADLLGIKNVVNLARPGFSNKYIAHTANQFLFEPNDLVVILWTHDNRTGFFENSHTYKNIAPWELSKYSRRFLKTYHTDYDLRFQNQLFQDYQKLYFRQQKIDYFYDCIGEHKETDDLEFMNLNYQIHRLDYPKASDSVHMGEEGHYNFAKKWFEKIQAIQSPVSRSSH